MNDSKLISCLFKNRTKSGKKTNKKTKVENNNNNSGKVNRNTNYKANDAGNFGSGDVLSIRGNKKIINNTNQTNFNYDEEIEKNNHIVPTTMASLASFSYKKKNHNIYDEDPRSIFSENKENISNDYKNIGNQYLINSKNNNTDSYIKINNYQNNKLDYNYKSNLAQIDKDVQHQVNNYQLKEDLENEQKYYNDYINERDKLKNSMNSGNNNNYEDITKLSSNPSIIENTKKDTPKKIEHISFNRSKIYNKSNSKIQLFIPTGHISSSNFNFSISDDIIIHTEPIENSNDNYSFENYKDYYCNESINDDEDVLLNFNNKNIYNTKINDTRTIQTKSEFKLNDAIYMSNKEKTSNHSYINKKNKNKNKLKMEAINNAIFNNINIDTTILNPSSMISSNSSNSSSIYDNYFKYSNKSYMRTEENEKSNNNNKSSVKTSKKNSKKIQNKNKNNHISNNKNNVKNKEKNSHSDSVNIVYYYHNTQTKDNLSNSLSKNTHIRSNEKINNYLQIENKDIDKIKDSKISLEPNDTKNDEINIEEKENEIKRIDSEIKCSVEYYDQIENLGEI